MDNLVKVHGSGGYDSDFSDDEQGESSERGLKRKREEEILQKPFQKGRHSKVAHRSSHSNEVDREEARNRRAHLISMNAFERHKKFVGDYILYYGGQMADFKRSTTKDKTDQDVLRENHRFLWRDEDEEDMTWEKELAKNYYDKLFKEYCIADLSRYKENKFGFRWRTEDEVVSGKGQFQCGNKRCEKQEGLKSWEVNFAYVERGEKRNALVKLSKYSLFSLVILCKSCLFVYIYVCVCVSITLVMHRSAQILLDIASVLTADFPSKGNFHCIYTLKSIYFLSTLFSVIFTGCDFHSVVLFHR
uniref:FRA10A associated CGG repeat 1 n=1 Tax=Sparus aurata TaxID=8175 RepID=A0A671WR08_SPAAU